MIEDLLIHIILSLARHLKDFLELRCAFGLLCKLIFVLMRHLILQMQNLNFESNLLLDFLINVTIITVAH